ncbi:MAG TPA: hypothetical protein VGE11_08660 [Pseudonocardia sp.]
MKEKVLTTTRRSLHAVAEQLLAGPQYRAKGTIRLRVTHAGFAQVSGPWRVEGTQLVSEDKSVPLDGTIEDIARAAGIHAGVPEIYTDHADLAPDLPLELDPTMAAELVAWFVRGDEGLRAFAPEDVPVLWPEHFDLGIALDEVNYGISLGDAAHETPYAYVGPWAQRQGSFWNVSFGSLRAAAELPDAAAVTAYFAEGRAAAAAAAAPPVGA